MDEVPKCIMSSFLGGGVVAPAALFYLRAYVEKRIAHRFDRRLAVFSNVVSKKVEFYLDIYRALVLSMRDLRDRSFLVQRLPKDDDECADYVEQRRQKSTTRLQEFTDLVTTGRPLLDDDTYKKVTEVLDLMTDVYTKVNKGEMRNDYAKIEEAYDMVEGRFDSALEVIHKRVKDLLDGKTTN